MMMRHTLRFVCSSWRSATKQSKFRGMATVPLLVLPEDDASSRRRRLFSLQDHTVRHIELPLSCSNGSNNDDMRLLSSCGWLLSVSDKGKNISLLNPLSEAVIKLPTVRFYHAVSGQKIPSLFKYYGSQLFEKIILSTNPSTNADFQIAMILEEPYKNLCCWHNVIVFWSSNAVNQWFPLSEMESYTGGSCSDLLGNCNDICFYKGHFYGADSQGNVFRFDQISQDIPQVCIVSNLAKKGYILSHYKYNPDRDTNGKFIMYYMVESAGELLHVSRVKTLGDEYYSTTSFEIFELNLGDGTANKVDDLGTRAIFIGSNSSFSVDAYSYGCKPNCIYFTDEARSLFDYVKERHLSRGKDIGVYNLSNGEIECFHESITPHYNELTPLMWLHSPIL